MDFFLADPEDPEWLHSLLRAAEKAYEERDTLLHATAPDGPERSRAGVAAACDPTIKQRTTALVGGLSLVLEHHGAPPTVLRELDLQLHGYADSALDEMVWLKRMKFVLTYPLSRYLHNPLPPTPDVKFSPSGALRCWMKCRLNAFNRRNTHLWYSWLQAKRAALPVSAAIVAQTYRGHRAGLLRDDPCSFEDVERMMADPTMMHVLDALREKASRADLGRFVTRRTTASACWERSRGKGGQVAELCDRAGLPVSLLGRELVSMEWHPVVHTGTAGEKLYSVCVSVYETGGREEWATLANHARLLDWDRPLVCQIQAVLEPMKVRVISKGEALPYYVARPLQALLHGAMRKMEPFRLIGRPFCPTDLMDLRECSREGDEWFSVDYSAATDGLSSRLGLTMLEYILADQPEDVRDCAARVLGRHRLVYKPFDRDSTEQKIEVTQRRGQLMGSILSFPVLCLANLAVYLAVTAESHRGWTHTQRLRHVLVNGDDMVYTAQPELWDDHVRVGASVGLEMSVGKAYHHRVYANVNSTSVHCDLRDPSGTPWQIDYLNAGLFFGQHKVLGRVENEAAKAHLAQDPEGSLASNLSVVLRGARASSRLEDHMPRTTNALFEKYKEHHGQALWSECLDGSGFSRSLFLPKSVGGMGVEPFSGYRLKLRPSHKFVATTLACGSSAYPSFGRPCPGYEVTRVEDLVSVPWDKPIGSGDKPRLRSRINHQLDSWACRLGVSFWSTCRHGAVSC